MTRLQTAMAQIPSRPHSVTNQALADLVLVDAEYVLYRLEEAGRTLLALPNVGPTTRLRTSRHDIVQSAIEAYGWQNVDQRVRPAIPSHLHVTRMDEALDWIPLIPRDRYVLRRIVGARALVSPVTERHLFSWRRLATLLGADHKAIQRWHAQGVDLIVNTLNASQNAPHPAKSQPLEPARRMQVCPPSPHDKGQRPCLNLHSEPRRCSASPRSSPS